MKAWNQRLVLLLFLICFITFDYNNDSNYLFVNGETLSNGQDVDKFVDNIINSADVMVFAKSYCPYCKGVLSIFESLRTDIPGWTLRYINLDMLPDFDGPLIQMEVLTKTKLTGVPTTFILGQGIVGWEDIQDMFESGELSNMLLNIGESLPIPQQDSNTGNNNTNNNNNNNNQI